MNVFDNIAVNNPEPAIEFLQWHGLDVDPNDPAQIADGLAKVSQVSKPHLKDVLSMHPDKDIILELFSYNPSLNNPSGIDHPELRIQAMKQSRGADGSESSMAPITAAPATPAATSVPAVPELRQLPAVSTTDLVIVMASLLIAFAIVTGKSSGK